MKKYFYIQLKRAVRFLPFVFTISVILCLTLAFVFNNFLLADAESENKQRFRIAVTGDTEDTYLKVGLKALESFDSSRFSIEFINSTEDEAKVALRRGDVAAYIVVPEGFSRAALRGEIRSVKYVTTEGAVGLVSIFKNEIATAVSDLLYESQKGVYGVYNALNDTNYDGSAVDEMNVLAIEYVDYILDRADSYKVNELGISDGKSLSSYLIGGMLVLFLILLALPFASLLISEDNSVHRILKARNISSGKQVLCEFLPYLISMLIILAAFFIVIFAGCTIFLPHLADMLTSLVSYLPAIFIVAVMTCSLSFFMFEASGNLVGGILLYFFISTALCYITGCVYPSYAFPVAVQTISRFLPTGIARSFLSDSGTALSAIGLIAYSGLFLALSVAIRRRKIEGRRVSAK